MHAASCSINLKAVITNKVITEINISKNVQYFFPVSSHIITRKLISERICFDFFLCIDYLGCYQHLMKISCQYNFRNMFTMNDVFNNYVTCWIQNDHICTRVYLQKKLNIKISDD